MLNTTEKMSGKSFKSCCISLLLMCVYVQCDGDDTGEVAADFFTTEEDQFENLDVQPGGLNATLNLTDHLSTETKEDLVNGSLSSELLVSNDTEHNVTYKVSCYLNNTDFVPVVEMVNSSRLLTMMHVEPNVTSLQTPATCVVVFFFSPSCPFSCSAAPHFNALPRFFPDIQMAALDTSVRYTFNAQYGILGLPSVLLFHNGRPAARFNSSSEFTLEAFSKFITNNTGINPQGKLYVASVDFNGPISSVVVQQTDYCLVLSWIFILLCCVYYFYYSPWCSYLAEAVRNAWREAEAHQHID